MCGIIGYYREAGLRQADVAAVTEALDTMRHRGPDGAGIVLINVQDGRSWTLQLPDSPADLTYDLQSLATYEEGQAHLILGHRRLSIFDLSSRGHQPMRDEAGNQFVFNGEVYNFPEIRSELQALGHQFQTETDTEVIMAAHRQWGPDALKRYNGMWSMLLWDQKERKVLVSNDRIGIKQLYMWGNNEEWLYASEMKPARHLRKGQLSLNQATARHFLRIGNISFSEETLFHEIRRFRPAHFQYAAPDQLPHAQQKRYWDFPLTQYRGLTADDAALKLRELFDDAVRIRMRSDVPWGTTLSGGLDSSSIIYAAHALRQKVGENGPIRTFTATFPGEEGDESAFVRQIEKDLSLNAEYIHPISDFDFDDFERHLYHQDQPVVSTSMYAQYAVMRSVSESPVKVLLDGQGGDELFAGYHHHFYKYARGLLMKGRLGAYKRAVKDFCALKGIPVAQVKSFVKNDIKLALKLKFGGKMTGPEAVTTWNKASSLRDVLQLDITSWVMPMLLHSEDRNSMAFGLEARLPFLDYRIVEFAMQIPDRFKIHEGWQKHILRQAMPDLPDSIRWRKDKKGFTTPMAEWVKRYKTQFLDYARIAEAHGVERPWKGELETLATVPLFRLASLGAWMQASGYDLESSSDPVI